jgi:hypothetical protein
MQDFTFPDSISPHLPFIWRCRTSVTAPNTWTYFRKEFSWEDRGDTQVYLAADPTARLWINGQVVVARVMRFVSPFITLEPVDLKPYLRKGKNVAVLLHHFWGIPTFQRSSYRSPGVALVGQILSTEAGWCWKEAPEFLAHPYQTSARGDKRIRFPVVMDLRKVDLALHEVGYQDQDWKEAERVDSEDWENPVLKETPPLEREAFFPQSLVAYGSVSSPDEAQAPFPPVPMSWLAKQGHYVVDISRMSHPEALTGRADTSAVLEPGIDGYLTLDFGKPMHGTLYLELEDADSGTILDFTHGELRRDLRKDQDLLGKDGAFDPEITLGAPCGDRVILRSGAQQIEIPEERTCRWLMITWRGACKSVKIRSIRWMSSQYPGQVKGTFVGGSQELLPLIALSLDHARVTMSDVYVDTPGREDAQWLEDIQYRAQLSAQWMGDARLRQVTLRHAVEQQAANGRFRIFPPESYNGQGLQSLDWGMVWIGILYDDWMWTGDTERVRRYFPSLTRFLEVAHTQTNGEGMLVDRSCMSDIRSAERPCWDEGELESIPNAWYHGFLRNAAVLAQAIGEEQRADLWSERADRVRNGFQRFLLPTSQGSSVGEVWSPLTGARTPGQAAVVSAVFYGLLGESDSSDVLESAFVGDDGSPPPECKRWNNPTYAYRALRSLTDHGMGKKAARHFLERYRPYLPDGPLPEYFILGEGQPEDPTGSHGWAAVPLVWLHDSVLGIRLAKAGGHELIWQPTDVGWPDVQGKTMTPQGICEVRVDWKLGHFALTLPDGVSAEVRLPKNLGEPEMLKGVEGDEEECLIWKEVRGSFSFQLGAGFIMENSNAVEIIESTK